MTETQKKIIGHFSGGFDSVAACLMELEQGHIVHGHFINYGQAYAEREFTAALKLSEILSDKFENWQGFVQTEVEMMVQSSTNVDFYVPVRNLVLVALSVQYAVAENYNAVAVGMRTVKRRPQDPHCFRDASIPFITLLQAAVNEACEEGVHVELRMPLIGSYGSISKLDAMRKLLQHGFDLNLFWNCFSDRTVRCGKCLHCLEFVEHMALLQHENLGTI